jgi:hypothetical protein
MHTIHAVQAHNQAYVLVYGVKQIQRIGPEALLRYTYHSHHAAEKNELLLHISIMIDGEAETVDFTVSFPTQPNKLIHLLAAGAPILFLGASAPPDTESAVYSADLEQVILQSGGVGFMLEGETRMFIERIGLPETGT